MKKDTWLAHYTYNLAKSNYEHEYKMWQLCSDGKIDGIQDYVDIDIYYK
jgi:GH25 family lysozyme M1 (1,4-beta-N-acetylmuramidase)